MDQVGRGSIHGERGVQGTWKWVGNDTKVLQFWLSCDMVMVSWGPAEQSGETGGNAWKGNT